MDPLPKIGKLPQKKENLLKRRKDASALRAQRVADRLKNQQYEKEKTKTRFKRIESYIKQERCQQKDLKRAVRVAHQPCNYHIGDEAKAAFVVRVRGINQVHPRVRKIMRLFRLFHVNSGTFVRLNDATAKMMQIIEPYVVWGIPNLKTIHDLMFKRGFGQIENKRIALNDNKTIEQALGKHDILCVDDLIHAVHSVGSKFDEVNKFLCPFKLEVPSGGWPEKPKHKLETGDFGCREDQINALLRKMI